MKVRQEICIYYILPGHRNISIFMKNTCGRKKQHGQQYLKENTLIVWFTS